MHIPSHPLHTTAHCNPLQPAANHPVHIQCTHCSSHYIFSTHCSQSPVHTAAILSSAHCSYIIQYTLQLYYPVHTATNLQCTLQLYYPVHTAANLQCTLQQIFSAHCSYTIQCTLQLYYPVHTAATLSGSNTIQCIQYTFEPPQDKPIPLLAYLYNSQQTLMVDNSSPYDEEDWLFVAVH